MVVPNVVSKVNSGAECIGEEPVTIRDEPGRKGASRQLEITYVATHLPYPVDLGGGERATHSVLQSIAPFASVSVLVLTGTRYDNERIREAENYYGQICRSFACHTFADLSPSRSPIAKAWHYLSGQPRQGFWSEQAERTLLEQVKHSNSKVVWCDTTHEAKYLRGAKRAGCRTVLTTQNMESDVIRQEIKRANGTAKVKLWVRWRDLRRLEKLAARWADILTGITDLDVESYRRTKRADRVFLLPEAYPVTDNPSNVSPIKEEPNTICFVGSMEWPPNIAAAQYMVREIMPEVWKMKPEAKCYVVGRNAGRELLSLASENIIVTGTVPSVMEYYERVAVVAVPITGIAGVKVKLMEAMAAGKAVVSTSAGAVGLNVESGKHLLIADTAAQFANALIQLLDDASLREGLGNAARQYVAEQLSPECTKVHAQRILACLSQL